MDYILVVISVVCIAVQFSLSKVYQVNFAKGTKSLLLFPMLMSIIAAIFFFTVNGFKLEFSAFTFLVAICLGVLTTVNNLLSIIVVKYGKISVYTVFMMLGGMLLPYGYGVLFLSEKPSIISIIGIIILIVSLIFPITEKRTSKDKNNKILILLCFVVFCVNGSVSILSKMHQISAQALTTNNFLIWNYIISFVLSFAMYLVYCLLFNRKSKQNLMLPNNNKQLEEKSITKHKSKTAILGVMVIILFALISGVGYMLQLIGAKNLPASVLYPIVTGGTILLTTLSGFIFFKEKISRNILISLIMTLIGTILLLF